MPSLLHAEDRDDLCFFAERQTSSGITIFRVCGCLYKLTGPPGPECPGKKDPAVLACGLH